MKNTSQDPDYEGPVGHERRVHKDKFHVKVGPVWRKGKKWNPREDPEWEEYRPGRFRPIPKDE